MELLFERFLSEERGEWPDIDIDLPSGEQREKVIQYVFAKYGARGAAMTAVVISYRTRLAVREMGKVLGLGDRAGRPPGGAALEPRAPRRPRDARATLRQAGVDARRRACTAALRWWQRCAGCRATSGQHTGGIVIAAGRLDEVVPIEPARMPERRVIQWDKEDCADLG